MQNFLLLTLFAIAASAVSIKLPELPVLASSTLMVRVCHFTKWFGNSKTHPANLDFVIATDKKQMKKMNPIPVDKVMLEQGLNWQVIFSRQCFHVALPAPAQEGKYRVYVTRRRGDKLKVLESSGSFKVLIMAPASQFHQNQDSQRIVSSESSRQFAKQEQSQRNPFTWFKNNKKPTNADIYSDNAVTGGVAQQKRPSGWASKIQSFRGQKTQVGQESDNPVDYAQRFDKQKAAQSNPEWQAFK